MAGKTSWRNRLTLKGALHSSIYHATGNSKYYMTSRKEKNLPWKPSIRFYLIIINLVLLCLLFPAVSLLYLKEDNNFRDLQLKRTITQMRQSLENRSASLARSISLSASQAVAGYDFTFLNIMVQDVVSNDPDIIYAIIMDENRLAMVHSNASQIGNILDHPIDRAVAATMNKDFPAALHEDHPKEIVRFLDYETDTEPGKVQVMEVFSPIYSGAQLWGVLRFGYSLERLQHEMDVTERDWAAKLKNAKKYFLSITGLFFTIGLLIAGLFTRFFVNATQILTEGVNRVSEGDLDHAIAYKELACGEFVNLAKTFNDMTAKLKDSYRKLDEYSKSLEQKVEERTRELKTAQANLVQQAHEAGMAEMAVGILHNIGNAITPAKVGASLLSKRLKESPLRNHLDKAMHQIHEVVSTSDQLTGEERKRLLDITKLLPENIKEEYNQAIDSVQNIEKKHEYIESIISLQMRYAHLFDDAEQVDINQLVDDALKMLNDSLTKRAIKVTRNFSEIPPVKMEQTKLIQIVINLVKNAYEAMDGVESSPKDLIITTYVENAPPRCVVLSIKDFGVGLSSDEQDKIFQFGYTTKSRGSGFGLHSCANYIIANNGAINVFSEGKNKGAEFVIKLPVSPPADT